MIKFEKLIEEINTIVDMDELESTYTLFNYGLTKGAYIKLNTKVFNDAFETKKNRILTDLFYEAHKDFNYMMAYDIIKEASDEIKDNMNSLNTYIKDIAKNLKGKCA